MTARVAFDPNLPLVVASSGFVYRGRRYAKGETFPGVGLGLAERELHELWYGLKIDCQLPPLGESAPQSSPPTATPVRAKHRGDRMARSSR